MMTSFSEELKRDYALPRWGESPFQIQKKAIWWRHVPEIRAHEKAVLNVLLAKAGDQNGFIVAQDPTAKAGLCPMRRRPYIDAFAAAEPQPEIQTKKMKFGDW